MAKNKTAVALDTNIVLRLILNDVPAQTQLAEHVIQTNHCELSDLALTETVFVLEKVYKMNRTDVTKNITAVIRNAKLNCNRLAFERALPVYQDTPGVSINDCLLVACAELNNTTPLMTFDQKLAKVFPDSVTLVS